MKRRLLLPDVIWKVSERPVGVRRPEDVMDILRDVFPRDSRERFFAVYLDARHKPMSPPHLVSLGSLNASLVHPREVFAPAVAMRAAAVVVAHNHPSGDKSPSADDLELTGRLDKAGEIMGIALLDHIIVSTGDIHGEEDMAMTSVREYGWPDSGQSCR